MKFIMSIRLLLNRRLPQSLLSLSVFLLSTFFLSGCDGGRNVQHGIQDALGEKLKNTYQNPYLYILEFDSNGKLTSFDEPARAIRELSKDTNIDGVVVLSLGWNHNRDTIVPEYHELLKKYKEWKHQKYKVSNERPESLNKKAVFIISWESSLTGLSHFFGDVMPLPEAAIDFLSKPFNPLTYWSKARQADRIGFGDLKPALVEVICQVNNERKQQLKQPQGLGLYVVAHSFGSRIVTGMLSGYDDKNIEPNENKECPINTDKSKNFPKGTVKGGLLIQPALSSYELHSLGSKSKDSDLPSYPLLVTESRHDHSNRALFPLINIPLNSAYLRYSGLIKPYFFEKIFGSDIAKNNPTYETWSNGYDYVMFPFMFSYSAIALVDSYLFGQFREIFIERGWRYIPDTLAQLPILEIPVESINVNYTNPQKPDDYWGQRHKGLFHLGAMHESAATIITANADSVLNRLTSKFDNQRIGGTALVHTVCTQAELIEHQPQCDFSNGIIPIEMSEEIDTGIAGEDLSTAPPLTDWTIGWLDPIGAHSDYETPEIYELIFRLLEHQD